MRKFKKISIIICIILLFYITKSYATTGKVSTDAVRVRKEPNTTSEIITVIYENDEVEILETSGDWYKIKYSDNQGYVKKEFLLTENESKGNEPNKQTNNTTNKTNNESEKNNTVNNNQTTNSSSETQNANKANNTENSNVQNNETQNNEIQNNNQVNTDSNNLTTIGITNLRLIPSLTSKVISTFEQGKQVTKIQELKNWIKVTDGTVTGWILKSKLTKVDEVPPVQVPEESNKKEEPEKEEVPETQKEESSSKKGKVNVETANVREKADLKAEIIGFLDYNDIVTIISEEGDWYKVTGDGVTGYVSKKLISLDITSRSLEEPREDETVINQEENVTISQTLQEETKASNRGVEVANYAKQYLGNKYVSGGKTPSSGFDCSGFTKYVYSNFGYTLGNTAASQNNLGTEVSRENLEPGDLILFYDEGKTKIGHTGVYVGDGNFVHSANAQRGVVTDNLNTNTYYNTRIFSIKRIVQ